MIVPVAASYNELKPAEGGEGEMPVTAGVCCRLPYESTAALPAVGLPLVPNLAVTH